MKDKKQGYLIGQVAKVNRKSVAVRFISLVLPRFSGHTLSSVLALEFIRTEIAQC